MNLKSLVNKKLTLKQRIKDMRDKNLKDKRGVLGLDTATAFVIALLVLVVVAVAFIIALGALNTASVNPAGSAEANSTTQIIANATAGIEELFSSATTWFSLLAVVIIILIIVIVIVAVRGLGGTGRTA